jgi:two-component system, NarL family, invasion response regulator UvrY
MPAMALLQNVINHDYNFKMQTEKIRIIIADDHEMIRTTWKLLLQQDGRFEVIAECSNGEELLRLLPQVFPDVILLDINMSPINGFEATKKIIKQWPHARIIGMSINDQPVYAKNLLQLGASGYVTKDSSRAEVARAIIEVMNGKTYVCEDIKKKVEPHFLSSK